MADFGTDEWLAQAREELKAKPCYRCSEVGGMTLEWELHGRPLGSFSLAGNQLKASVNKVLIMSHEDCGLRGRITPNTGGS